MFGAIIGSVGGSLVSGVMDNVMGGNGNGGGGGLLGGLMDNILGGGQGGGMLDGLGNLAGKLLDPLGLLTGGEEQQSGMPDDVKDLLGTIKEMLQDLMSQIQNGGLEETTEEAAQTSDAAPAPGGPLYVSGGSGDDVITIGQPTVTG